jgi:hypothetical protein
LILGTIIKKIKITKISYNQSFDIRVRIMVMVFITTFNNISVIT